MTPHRRFTIGHAWTTDYGDPDTAEGFGWVLPYSPIHNVAQPEGGSGQCEWAGLLSGWPWLHWPAATVLLRPASLWRPP